MPRGDLTADTPSKTLTPEMLQMRAGEAAAAELHAEARRQRDHTRLVARIIELRDGDPDFETGFMDKLGRLMVSPPPLCMPSPDC